jgi:hypothetical protein
MLVYRICTENEKIIITEDKSFDEAGVYCSFNPQLNTHNYYPDVKYLHFFKDYDSIFYLLVAEGDYLCTYDIPEWKLNNYIGEGSYLDRENYRNPERAIEYAIPVCDLKYEYLNKIERITRYVDYNDFLEGNYEDGFETVYEKGNKVKSKNMKKED